MRIAVIGRGNIGGTLGGKWADAGHDVVYGVRDPRAGDEARPEDVVSGAEVVVLAVPGAAAKGVVAGLRNALAGKVVVDATNDVAGGGALPVRAFNTLGWENFADPVVAGTRVDLLFGAQDGRAREVAERLIRDVGLEPVWVGGPEVFDIVDGVTRLWFTLVFQRGLGRRLAFKVLREV
jgi:predicted dinucleotide-binding enzyme